MAGEHVLRPAAGRSDGLPIAIDSNPTGAWPFTLPSTVGAHYQVCLVSTQHTGDPEALACMPLLLVVAAPPPSVPPRLTIKGQGAGQTAHVEPGEAFIAHVENGPGHIDDFVKVWEGPRTSQQVVNPATGDTAAFTAPAYTPGDPGANTFQSQFFIATCPQPECIQASVAGPWIVIDGTPPPPPPGDDTIYYFDTDAIGSVRLITDAAGNEAARKSYLPFGSEWGSTSTPNGNADRVKFAGKERDGESGLDYSLARYLSDNLGRFLSADDVMFGRPGDPQSWNLYAYARNNPLRFVDPTGHEPECPYDSCVSAPMPNDDLLNWLLQRWWIELVPVVGSGSQAVEDIRSGCVQGAVFNGAMAVSDAFLVKGAATAIGRGAWKTGSHAWKATRSWYGKSRELAFGQHVHHWLIPQRAEVPEWIVNQPFNLMPIEPPNGYTYQQWHNAIEGKGAFGLSAVERLIYGVPTWAQNVAANTAARAGQVADWLGCK